MDALKLAFLLSCAMACTVTSIEKPSSSTAGVPTESITISVMSASSDGVTADVMIDVDIEGVPATLGKDDALRLVDGIGGSAAFVEGDANFEAKLATADTALAIELVRSGAVDATVSIPLPPPFVPAVTVPVSRASGLSLSWQAAPPFPMEIVATGSPCLPTNGFTAHLSPDPGAFEIQPADLITTPGACTITVTFTRGSQRTQVRTLTVPTKP